MITQLATEKELQNATLLKAKVLSGVGGLYRVITENGTETECRAKGVFRHSGISPYPGDNVVISPQGNGADCICDILPRKNIFNRPPAANIDKLFITVAAASPSPAYITIDKLLCAAEYYRSQAIILVTKSDLDPQKALQIKTIYEKSGYKVFVTSSLQGSGIDELKRFVCEEMESCTSVFAGESGVGKSSLMNALFPSLALKTGAVSRKISRGKHTTRAVTLYPLNDVCSFTGAFLADTPGFGIFELSSIEELDFDDVANLFPEFASYIGNCRYTKCTHLREQGCAVLEAIERNKIATERHSSYVTVYEEIKALRPWRRRTK